MTPDAPQQQGARRAFIHEAPEAGLRIWFDFGVVDRIASDVLRGLSALPRRGIEVGGLLLGTVETARRPALVRIEDYVPFPCEHLYGPNFHLSPKDKEAFAELVSSWSPAPGRPIHCVGFYRSHTRGDLELTAEDIEVLDAWLPHPHAVCLILRPYATRPAEAAFWFRRQGSFQPGPPASTFPFRRRELGGGTPQKAAPASAPEPVPAVEPDPAPAASVETWLHTPAPAPASAPSRAPAAWLWIPALLAFLLVGVVIGVQLPGHLRQPASAAPPADPFALGLSAVQFGNAIHLRWNPQAPAIAACRNASLIIRDGPNLKIIDLRKEDLARGALIYRYASPAVNFRMEAMVSPANTVSESIDLRLLPPAEPGAAPAAGAPEPEKANPVK